MKIHQINIFNNLKYLPTRSKTNTNISQDSKFDAYQYDANIFKNQFIPFMHRKSRPVYIIYEDGSYKRFE